MKIKVENYVEWNVLKSEVALYFDFCNPSLCMLPNIRLFHNWVIFYFLMPLASSSRLYRKWGSTCKKKSPISLNRITKHPRLKAKQLMFSFRLWLPLKLVLVLSSRCADVKDVAPAPAFIFKRKSLAVNYSFTKTWSHPSILSSLCPHICNRQHFKINF